jgi:Putative Flp pilus-assembly TadE/G-like
VRPFRDRSWSVESDSVESDSVKCLSVERGSAMPLLIVAIVFAGLCALGLAKLSGVALERSTAQQAADASALAGARYGYSDAQQLAAANGGSLVSFGEHFDGPAHIVDVVVMVHDVSATATARWDPPPPPPTVMPTTTLISTTEFLPETTVPGLILTIP